MSFFPYSQDTPLSSNNNYKINNINKISDGPDDSNDGSNNSSKQYTVSLIL
jgi:hypothetical protein